MNTSQNHIWKSKTPESLPDFIIGGAMKSGTTSLHAILDNHPDIVIAHDELGFFDMDSLLQHPDFHFYNEKNKQWTRQSMNENPDALWNWYFAQFKDLKNNGARLIGEDSTTYLCSENAAKRISLQDKPIKLIFILRHPTKRTISNYLHLLKSGRAIYSLEDTLRYNPNSIIKRSLYNEQLAYYYRHMPFENIKVVLFEDLIENKSDCIKDVCNFLDVDFDKLDKTCLNIHSNKTRIPKYIKLQLFRNRLLRKSGDYRYSKALPIQPDFLENKPMFHRLVDKLHKKINPHKSDRKFKASKATLSLLDDFFKSEFQGFDELTKKEILSKWFKNN